jgi:hypothetical protein
MSLKLFLFNLVSSMSSLSSLQQQQQQSQQNITKHTLSDEETSEINKKQSKKRKHLLLENESKDNVDEAESLISSNKQHKHKKHSKHKYKHSKPDKSSHSTKPEKFDETSDVNINIIDDFESENSDQNDDNDEKNRKVETPSKKQTTHLTIPQLSTAAATKTTSVKTSKDSEPMTIIGSVIQVTDIVPDQMWTCPRCKQPDDPNVEPLPMIGCDSCDDWYHWLVHFFLIFDLESLDTPIIRLETLFNFTILNRIYLLKKQKVIAILKRKLGVNSFHFIKFFFDNKKEMCWIDTSTAKECKLVLS